MVEMCVGIPGKVIEVKGQRAKVKQADHEHWLDLFLIDGKVKKDDYLLSYQEAAINKISPQEAKETLKLLE